MAVYRTRYEGAIKWNERRGETMNDKKEKEIWPLEARNEMNMGREREKKKKRKTPTGFPTSAFCLKEKPA